MINIVIVEDHALFRKGVKGLLSKIDDYTVIAEFANGKEYINNVNKLEADIVLMDVEMPILNGIEACLQSKKTKPDLHIIALSMYGDQKYYYDMIKAGVSGFVLKEASPEELVKAIRDVYNGLGFFSLKLLQQVIISVAEIENKNKQIEQLKLTDREIEVLNLICQGLTNKEISDKIFVSPRTVESHKAKLLQKINVKNTACLIIYAIKNNLIEI